MKWPLHQGGSRDEPENGDVTHVGPSPLPLLLTPLRRSGKRVSEYQGPKENIVKAALSP
jgi:hypothetical protein